MTKVPHAGDAYLDDVPTPRNGRSQLMSLWLALVILFLLAFESIRPVWDPRDRFFLSIAVLGVMGLVTAALFAITHRKARAAMRALAQADRELANDDLDAAVTGMRRMLARRQQGTLHVRGLLLLGRCAERRGDFAAAARVFAQIPMDRSWWSGIARHLAEHLCASTGVRHAFALAAIGDTDAASAVLDLVSMAGASPGDRVLAVRARAVIHARRGETTALLALLRGEATSIQNSLVLRDRLLLQVLARLSGGAPIVVEPELREWIARVVPDAERAMVEA